MAPAVGVFSHGPVGAQDDDFFSNKYPRWIVGLYTIPRSIFMAPAVGVFSHGPVGAQDDDFFLTNIHGGLLGYTPPPARFSWRRR
jgi:hypothetical protein